MTKARDLASNSQGGKPTLVDAKGDLIVGSAADTADRLAVGSDGSIIVADSAATTGLRWQGNYSAGKNKIINGDFNIWQRGTSFSNPSSGSYTSDRWLTQVGGSSITQTVSRQAFTPGTAPVSGYEGAFFLRNVYSATSPSSNKIIQRIEDVRTLAGQAATISFWAKADTNRTLTLYFDQNFGSGGSASANGLSSTTFSLTTSWQRFTYSGTVASISGKTIGTSSYLSLEFELTFSGSTLDLWGVQVEAGSVATAFQTATGTLAGELYACMRYYEKSYAQEDAPGTATGNDTVRGSWNAAAATTGTVGCNIQYLVEKRTTPTLTIYDTAGASGKCSRNTSGYSPTANQTVTTFNATKKTAGVESTGTQSAQFIIFHYTSSAEL